MQKLCFETQQPWEAEPEEWRPWESNQSRRPGMIHTKARLPGWKSETAASIDFVPSGTFFNVPLIDDQVNLSHWFFSSIPYLLNHPCIYFEMMLPTTSRTNLPAPGKIPHFSRINVRKFRKEVLWTVQNITLTAAQNVCISSTDVLVMELAL